MKNLPPMKTFPVVSIVIAAMLCGCAPKIGSKAWCEAMEKKPRGDVTFNEAADFAKYCVLQMKPEE